MARILILILAAGSFLVGCSVLNPSLSIELPREIENVALRTLDDLLVEANAIVGNKEHRLASFEVIKIEFPNSDSSPELETASKLCVGIGYSMLFYTSGDVADFAFVLYMKRTEQGWRAEAINPTRYYAFESPSFDWAWEDCLEK